MRFAVAWASSRGWMSRGLLAWTVALAALPVDAEAQSRVRTAVDTTLANVGDRITLSVTVEHPVDAAVSWPDSLDLSPFEVLDARVLPTEADGEAARSTVLLSLAAFELGELEVPSFEVAVLGPDGSTESLETDRYGVEVVSVGSDEGGDIREIRGPLSIPLSAVTAALWAVLLVLLGVGLYAGLQRLGRKGTPEEPTSGPPPRPAHEIALEALDALEASPLLGHGQVKEYHIELSDILRRYVEARFSVTALEMTTWEVLRGLERSGVDREVRSELKAVLEPCDLVKFAKVRPREAESRELLVAARTLVRRSIAHLQGLPEVGEEVAV